MKVNIAELLRFVSNHNFMKKGFVLARIRLNLRLINAEEHTKNLTSFMEIRLWLQEMYYAQVDSIHLSNDQYD